MLYIERRGLHEVEHWARDAQLLLVASHKPPIGLPVRMFLT